MIMHVRLLCTVTSVTDLGSIGEGGGGIHGFTYHNVHGKIKLYLRFHQDISKSPKFSRGACPQTLPEDGLWVQHFASTVQTPFFKICP